MAAGQQWYTRESRSVAKVLVVEDDIEQMKFIRNLLESMNHMVIEAEDVSSALEEAQVSDPDLILIDYMLPGKSGFSLCERLIGIPHLSFIPRILMTSRNEKRLELEALREYADDFVAKPFDPEVFMARIGVLLRRTIARVQSKKDVVRVLRSIEHRLRKNAYSVFSPILGKNMELPAGWKAPVPDLLAFKWGQNRAYFIENKYSLMSEENVSRWETVASQCDTSLRIVVRSKEDCRVAKSLLDRNRIPGKVSIVRKKNRGRHRDKIEKLHRLCHENHFTMTLLALGISTTFIASFFLWVFTTVDLAAKDQYGIYQPKDIERQIDRVSRNLEFLKKTITRP